MHVTLHMCNKMSKFPMAHIRDWRGARGHSMCAYKQKLPYTIYIVSFPIYTLAHTGGIVPMGVLVHWMFKFHIFVKVPLFVTSASLSFSLVLGLALLHSECAQTGK